MTKSGGEGFGRMYVCVCMCGTVNGGLPDTYTGGKRRDGKILVIVEV